MKLVTDWKEAWTWLSVHIAVIIGVLNALQSTVPLLQAYLTPSTMGILNTILPTILIWARLIQQGNTTT